MDVIKEIDLVLCLSGKSRCIVSLGLQGILKSRRTGAKHVKYKDTKGCETYSVCNIRGEITLAVKMPDSLLLMSWVFAPMKKFMKLREIGYDQPCISLQVSSERRDFIDFIIDEFKNFKIVHSETATAQEIVFQGLIPESNHEYRKNGIPSPELGLGDPVACYSRKEDVFFVFTGR